MRNILLLSDVNSSHTQKWALGLVSAGFGIGIFSLSAPVQDWFSRHGIQVFYEKSIANDKFSTSGLLKLRYFSSLKNLKDVVKNFRPDILHAHYATSYGGLGRMVKFHPFIISVWGSDVFVFPRKSFLHKWFVRKNLIAADRVLVTSKLLKQKVQELIHKDAIVTPFGIDVGRFVPSPGKNIYEKDVLVIGTIKSLERQYCVDVLISAFAKIVRKFPELKLRLLIVGGGSERSRLEALVKELDVMKIVDFKGKVPYEQVVGMHNAMDIFVNLSEYESFGVSVLEASACEKPVVASDSGGLPEVVQNLKTGFLVPVGDVEATQAAIEKLVLDKQLREKMGKEGRQFVLDHYDLEKSIQQLTGIYDTLIS